MSKRQTEIRRQRDREGKEKKREKSFGHINDPQWILPEILNEVTQYHIYP